MITPIAFQNISAFKRASLWAPVRHSLVTCYDFKFSCRWLNTSTPCYLLQLTESQLHFTNFQTNKINNITHYHIKIFVKRIPILNFDIKRHSDSSFDVSGWRRLPISSLKKHSILQHYLQVNVRNMQLYNIILTNTVYWDVEPCRSCVNRRIGGTYRLHIQGRNQGERYLSPKRRFTQDLHGATSQNTAFFIVTAEKTSNPTSL
jgi:hypothetical protein